MVRELYPFSAGCQNISFAYLTTDSSGDPVSEARYLPYGEERWTNEVASPADFGFTSQRADSYMELYDYGARWYDPQLGRFISPDTIIPDPANPQSWNRYAYVTNNPVKYVDPDGHCYGVASGLRGTFYSTTCKNLDMAHAIITSPDATIGQKAGAGLYAGAVYGAHTALAVGSTVAAVGCLTGAGTAVCAGAGSAVATVSADGDPTNEGIAAGNVLARAACADGDCGNEVKLGLDSFARASEYGIKSFNQLGRLIPKGSGLERHHIVEQRFAQRLGINPGQMPSVALTPEEHQRFTNLWRGAIGYNNSNNTIRTANATKDQIWQAAQDIYANYPELLEAARQTIFGVTQ